MFVAAARASAEPVLQDSTLTDVKAVPMAGESAPRAGRRSTAVGTREQSRATKLPKGTEVRQHSHVACVREYNVIQKRRKGTHPKQLFALIPPPPAFRSPSQPYLPV